MSTPVMIRFGPWQFVAGLVCCSRYLARHVINERVPIVMKSMLAWQVLVLTFLYTGVSIVLPTSGNEQVAVPENLFIFVAFCTPVMLDICNTTPTESRVSFGIVIFGILLGMVGNMLWFENTIIYEGFHATVNPQGRQVWTGRITKNGLRLNILYTMLLLQMGSLFTAFFFDQDHNKLYFVKSSRDKPDFRVMARSGSVFSFRLAIKSLSHWRQ